MANTNSAKTNEKTKSDSTEDFEKDIEKEVENEMEKAAEEWGENLEKKIEDGLEKTFGRYLEPAAGVVFGVVFLILFNVYYPRLDFFSSEFVQFARPINVLIILGIIFDFVKFFYNSPAYKLLTETIKGILFIAISYQIWIVFPFDTSVFSNPELWNTIIRIGIVVLPFFSILGILDGFAKLVKSKNNK